jgi:hypothetical protein
LCIGVIVEIDETRLGKRKYLDSYFEDVWASAGTEIINRPSLQFFLKRKLKTKGKF